MGDAAEVSLEEGESLLNSDESESLPNADENFHASRAESIFLKLSMLEMKP